MEVKLKMNLTSANQNHTFLLGVQAVVYDISPAKTILLRIEKTQKLRIRITETPDHLLLRSY